MVSFPTSVESFNPTKIYRETSKAVVLIAGFEKGQKVMSKGTGSIISRNGFVLTNAHVVINKNKGQPFKNLRIYIKPENISGDLKKDTTERKNVDNAMKLLVSETVNGAKIIDHWEHPVKNVLYALARVELNTLQKQIETRKELSDESRDTIRKKAEKLHDEMAKEGL